eukprot:TRINITY_DN6877_c0_g1_i2.p2 TRINITY_DN6877_c0_g1~~TRINITY_DN6877_c0_g1_i2.p2  ORF type:complete len:111 (-),score=9.41 TRINITY_DN6877_c0_g1_i2:114-446(-)
MVPWWLFTCITPCTPRFDSPRRFPQVHVLVGECGWLAHLQHDVRIEIPANSTRNTDLLPLCQRHSPSSDEDSNTTATSPTTIARHTDCDFLQWTTYSSPTGTTGSLRTPT